VITVLCGGVGAARFLAGLVQVVPPAEITAVVNTGDDTVLHGLAISPDLDTVTYTLAGAIDPERGWGLAGETWAAMGALDRYGAVRPAGSTAAGTWFSLGDRDLGTHLYRTHRLVEGAALSTVTAEIARAWDLQVHLLPMTDEPVRTMVDVAGEGEIGFQEYFVGRRHSVAITGVRFAGIDAARAAPGVLDALRTADVIVVAPSNPVVSIGPLLAIPGVRERLVARRGDVAAVSPIIGGRALKGPADRMLGELGVPVSAAGVARWYRDVAGTLVIDREDEALAPDVEEHGVRSLVTDTIMSTPERAAALARVVIGR
jgi:LPPG:FO 2-phospho-L-lactate transferase